MNNQRYVNSVYDPVFSQGNISSGHYQTIITANPSTFYDTENVMLPSPEYGAKELGDYTHQQPLTQQGDATSMLYASQIPSPTNLGNFIKQEVSICPRNEFKPECYSSHGELDMVIISQAQKFQGSQSNYFEKNFDIPEIPYPPTPTTPHNEKYLPEGFPITTTSTEININPSFNTTTLVTLSQQAEMFYEQGHYYLHVEKPRDPFLAFSHFANAANLGSKRGKHQLAYCFQHGIGVAVEIYLEIVDVDPPNAATLCQLGICFQMGIGVEADASRAIKYYERAVFMGHIDAMFNLAYCLRYGIGTQADHERACDLYYRMAQLGDPQGMKLLGNCKSAGIGTIKNDNEALEWFRRSSESDNYWGGKLQYALYLLQDVCTVQNYVEAYNLIRTICEDFPSCPGPIKVLLGRFYNFGIGCHVDLEKALHWYERALRSYHMQLCFVQECELLINNIRSRQYQNSIIPIPMFSKGVGEEHVVIGEGIGYAEESY
ncbi:8455_t:CDS:2 [Funneliformis geosporum]|uniref:8455_t:CDS:1 n=1 Tax=Funneliformis geosporum TaxID=1117311 RepID=A0A9W4WL74_9GLOM|nr:8455_t:CDS:2 [Funneliformis geosporum]